MANRWTLSLLLLLSLNFLVAQTATDAQSESDIAVTFGANRPPVPPPASWPRALGFLLLAAAAVWLVLRLLRRAHFRAIRNPQLFRHLGCQPLPGGGVLHLVLVDDRLYLLGAHSGQLRLLETVESAERRDRLLLLASNQAPARAFGALLSTLKGGR